ncbi:hypothetical protein BDN67DRAFT_985238 [Paxillus ammoniavirescens]|nr:hypothetical protein BDN67DRAFT_985238 [Paxillus ammoniavirescens]
MVNSEVFRGQILDHAYVGFQNASLVLVDCAAPVQVLGRRVYNLIFPDASCQGALEPPSIGTRLGSSNGPGSSWVRERMLTLCHSLTMWYPKCMYQYRVGLSTAGVGLADNDETPFSVVRILAGYSGAFSGLLSYVIGFMDFLMVDYPSTAKFLTPEERSFIIEKRGHDDDAQDDEQDVSQQVWAAFTDWQVWALAIVQASIAIPGYAISYFLPYVLLNIMASTISPPAR